MDRGPKAKLVGTAYQGIASLLMPRVTFFHATAFANLFSPEAIRMPASFAPTLYHPGAVLLEHLAGRAPEQHHKDNPERRTEGHLMLHEYVARVPITLTGDRLNMDEWLFADDVEHGRDFAWVRSYTIDSETLLRLMPQPAWLVDHLFYERFPETRFDYTRFTWKAGVLGTNDYVEGSVSALLYGNIVAKWDDDNPLPELWNSSEPAVNLAIRMYLAMRACQAHDDRRGMAMVMAYAALQPDSECITMALSTPYNKSTNEDMWDWLWRPLDSVQEKAAHQAQVAYMGATASVVSRLTGLVQIQPFYFDAVARRVARGFNVTGYSWHNEETHVAVDTLLANIATFLASRPELLDMPTHGNAWYKQTLERLPRVENASPNDPDAAWFYETVENTERLPPPPAGQEEEEQQGATRYAPEGPLVIALPDYAMADVVEGRLPRFRAVVNQSRGRQRIVLHARNYTRKTSAPASEDERPAKRARRRPSPLEREAQHYLSAMLALHGAPVPPAERRAFVQRHMAHAPPHLQTYLGSLPGMAPV